MQSSKLSVLFLCLGNICRSPAAEGIFRHKVEAAGLTDEFDIDSAGILDYHTGSKADARMIKHAAKRDYQLTSRARQIKEQDFARFDYIIYMDQQNHQALLSLGADYQHKFHSMASYCRHHSIDHVPDPYYGDGSDFEQVLDILEDACTEFLARCRR